MSYLNRKSRTQISQSIQIPLLQLPDINQSRSPAARNRSKQPLAFLKQPLLDNQDFLKEKTLYRNKISRKLSKEGLNKSQSYFVPAIHAKREKVDSSMEVPWSQAPGSEQKQKSIISCDSTEGKTRTRHFHRKTISGMETSFSRAPQRERLVTENPQSHSKSFLYSSIEQETQPDLLLLLNSPDLLKTETDRLKRQLSIAKTENQSIGKKLQQKNRELQDRSEELALAHSRNQQLTLELRRKYPVHTDAFINENKLENQLVLKDHFIEKLEQKIKYMELENSTLLKTKTERLRQCTQICKLKIRNKDLEEQLTILNRVRRNRLKGSMLSECSELSLNLSIEEDDLEKKYQGLKTSERTPEKARKADSRCYSQEQTDGARNWGQPKLVL